MPGQHRVEVAQHGIVAHENAHAAAQRGEHAGQLDGNVAATDDRGFPRQRIELEETVRRDSRFGARDFRISRVTARRNDDVWRRMLFAIGVDDDMTVDEAGVERHALDRSALEIALIDPVQPGDVGVPGALQRTEIVSALLDVEAVSGRGIDRLADLRGVPHDLFGHAADVHAGTAEAPGLEYDGARTILGSALRGRETAAAPTNYYQVIRVHANSTARFGNASLYASTISPKRSPSLIDSASPAFSESFHMASESSDLELNPLLGSQVLPRFSAIEPAHVRPAVERVLEEQRRAIAELETVEKPDSAWLEALEDVNESLTKVWGPVAHLNAVLSSPELRDAYNGCLPLITEFYTDLGQNRVLYERFVSLSESPAMSDPTVAKIVELGIRDFKLAGVALAAGERERFKEIMTKLATLQATFEQNVMDATEAFEYHEEDESQLSGIPAIAMERARAAAREKSLDGWLFHLDPPTYIAIMAHADSEDVRIKYYEAWNTRASDRGPSAGKWDNGPLIEEILGLRLEASRLLGFDTFSQQSLATKMAESPGRVIDFLRDLAKRSRSLAKTELATLATQAGRELEPWDVPYFSEKLKHEVLGISEEELRPYFSLAARSRGLVRRRREAVRHPHRASAGRRHLA